MKKEFPSGLCGTILLVEDDSGVRDLLQRMLEVEGHVTCIASDAVSAIHMVTHKGIRPDLILTDYELSGDTNGLALAERLRSYLLTDAGVPVPALILTGDTRNQTLRIIAQKQCAVLHKPVTLQSLNAAIQTLLQGAEAPFVTASVKRLPTPDASQHKRAVVYIVDDDAVLCDALRQTLESEGQAVEIFASCEAFLVGYIPGAEAFLLVDACLSGMTGLELLAHLRDADPGLPAIMMTGNGDIPTAVEAMRIGAATFIEKPFTVKSLLLNIESALTLSRAEGVRQAGYTEALNHLAGLTSRQREVLERVLAGEPSKNIAADLGISQRTVENYRNAIMRKTGARSLPALARLAVTAASSGR